MAQATAIPRPSGRCVLTGRLWWHRHARAGRHVLVLPGGPHDVWYLSHPLGRSHRTEQFVDVEMLDGGARECVPVRLLVPAKEDASASLLVAVTGASA